VSLMRKGILAGVIAAGMTQAQAETLKDTLISAYNNSNLLEQYRAVLRASDEDVASAVATLRPTLGYSAGRSYVWSPDLTQGTSSSDRDRFYDTLELTASMTLFDWGRNRLSVEAAKQAVLAARQSLVAQEQSVLYAAEQAYNAVRTASAFIDLRQNNVRVLTEEVRAAKDRFDVGEVTRTDVAQAEAALAAAQASLVSAQGDLATARESFKLAVGRYPGDLASPPSFPSLPASLDAARDTAVRTHPSIKQYQFTVSADETNVNIAQRAVMPSLSASASAGYSNSPNYYGDYDMDRDATLGVTISGPIYQGGQINATYRKAKANLDADRAALLQSTLQVQQLVGNAWAALKTAQASIKSTDEEIQAAQVAFDGTREEAKLGARTTLDVLTSEQDLLDARGDKITALQTEQDAYYYLLAQMGQLTAKNLGLDVVAYDPEAYYNSVRNAPTVFTSEQGIKLDKVLKSLGKQ